MTKSTVFLSAVTADIGRPLLEQLAMRIHNDFACVCRYRDNLTHGSDLLVEKLRQEIAEADFVLHLVGPSYGFGPMEVEVGERPADDLWRAACKTWWPHPELPVRRSYTQMEFDFALSLKKPVFVVFIDDPDRTAASASQGEANAALQASHRAAIRQRGHEYVRVDSVETLGELVNKLPVALQHLRAQIAERDDALDRAERTARNEGRRNYRLLTGLALVVLLTGGGVGWLIREQHRQSALLSEQRSSIPDEFYRILTQPDLSGEYPPGRDRREDALVKISREFKMTEEAVQQIIDAYVETIRSDPHERARALIFKGDYAAAERTALDAADAATDAALKNLVLAGDAQSLLMHHQDALRSYRRALVLMEDERSEVWFDTQSKVLVTLWRLARHQEALEMTDDLLAKAASREGNETVRFADLLTYKALMLVDVGQIGEATALLDRAGPIYDKRLGEKHPKTLTCLGNQALVVQAAGNNVEAEKLMRRVLRIREDVLGAADPDTAISRNNLALLLKKQGRFTEAEKLYRDALAVYETVRGARDRDTATILNNLASLLQASGQASEAEELFSRALDIRRRVLPPDHPDLATSLNNQALLFQSEGRPTEAEPLYEEARAIRVKSLGALHPDTLAVLNNLGACLFDLGRYDAAAKLLQQAIDAGNDAPGDMSASMARPLYWLARTRQAQKRPDLALQEAKRAVVTAEHAFGPDHAKTGEARRLLDELEQSTGGTL
jgi:tetratricopeptide (TPR) repeat protein